MKPHRRFRLPPLHASPSTRMAIEFPCANCGQQVRTPDTAAGKKGKCPNCGHVQRIPAGEPNPSHSPRPNPKPPATPAQPSAPTPPKPAKKTPPATSPSATPAASASPTPKPAKPKTSELIKPDAPPSLTPEPQSPAPAKPADPKLPPLLPTAPSKAASQWTSYVKRSADSVRPTPMPPADPRIAPRPIAPKQVLPRLESTAATPAAPPQAPAAEVAPKPPAPSSPPATTSNSDKVEFPCPGCGKTNRAPADRAGKKGRCPHCQTILTIPGAALPQAASSPPAKPAAPAATPTAAAQTPPASTSTPSADAPKVSARSQAPTNPALKGLTVKNNPIRPGKKWVTTSEPAEEIPSLTPLTPLAAAPVGEEPLPELTPLTPEQIARLVALEAATAAPALTPLGPVSGAGMLTPAPLDPMGALAPATLRPVGHGYANSGWATAPSHPRRGLPWEQDASFGPLLQTAASVLFTPATAFREMWQSGGLGLAIGYAALISFGVAVVVGVFTVLFVAAAGSLAAMNVRPPGSGGPFNSPALRGNLAPAVFSLLARQVGTNLGIATFQLTVSALITSGLTHGLLALFGAARGGFGTTFRVFLYCMASTAFFQLVPCCGFWIGLLWTLPILMIGISYAHDASGPAAAGAVFVGVGLYYSLLFLVLSILSLGILYTAGSGLGAKPGVPQWFGVAIHGHRIPLFAVQSTVACLGPKRRQIGSLSQMSDHAESSRNASSRNAPRCSAASSPAADRSCADRRRRSLRLHGLSGWSRQQRRR